MAATPYVAFFRNLNLGHVGSPGAAQLVAAFGGPEVARSFQTNGTVIFTADDPAAVAGHALDALAEVGFAHGMVLRSADSIRAAVEGTPEPAPAENVYRATISFFDLEQLPLVNVPVQSRDHLVELRRLGPDSASCVCWKPHATAGDVTGFLEGLLGVPVTTRTLGTVERLLATSSLAQSPS